MANQITINKYYDGVIIGTVTEIEEQQFTDKQYLLRDIIDGLSTITSGQTRKLIIEVSLDKQDRYKLTQRWRVL
jgi:hypothetical protein